MELTKCKICGKVIQESIKGRKKKYCSRKCMDRSYYLSHKEEIYKRTKLWGQKNPEKSKDIHQRAVKKYRENNRAIHNASVLKNYKNNKFKWRMRKNTLRYKKKIYKIKGEFCDICGTKEDLEFHHLSYVWEKSPIYNRTNLKLNIKKIQVLCKECHGKIHQKQKT